MSTLHNLTANPSEQNIWTSALSTCAANDLILLTQDGVYALLQQHIITPQMRVFQPDCQARGVRISNDTSVAVIKDYPEFVSLTLQFSQYIKW